jgi:hypothetical protein
MLIIFDCTHSVVNLDSFATGLLPPALPAPQADNLTDFLDVDSASIDEVTAHSIARTIAEETASYFDRLVEADRSAELERLAVADGWFAPVLSAF